MSKFKKCRKHGRLGCWLRTRIVVITPFSSEYNRYVLPKMKTGVPELLDAVPQDVHYVDFNQALDLFDPEDFMDTI